MGIYRSNKRRFQARQAAQKSVKSREENQKKRIGLVSDIKLLPSKQISAATHLFETMRYSQGPNKGPIKRHSQNQKAHHISQIRSLVRKYSMSPDEFQKQIKMLFKFDKRVYSSNTVWLATKISQVGQNSIRSTTECMKLIYEFLVGEPPKHWFSTSTLATWHKDVSQIQVNELLIYAQKVSSYGVMIDESTRGEIKQFVVCLMFWNPDKNFPVAQMIYLKEIKRCNGETIAKTVNEVIQTSNLDVQNCLKNYRPEDEHTKCQAKVNEWLNYLIEMKNNHYMFFANELNEALNLLNEQEFEKIIQDLERGLDKAIEHYKKWMMPWYHLPLSICNLGGDLSQSFARSFIHVTLGNIWLKPPTEQEIIYANQLQED
ncbi:6773_t:CDS:2 [Gigaspora margarita]|uniref:6773_t:CDS:1 n=1 Tax=Gigaspora margarita TaxID=4874 RepID=A0ABN7UEA8_GIGMA|nr:6773_t:CDS:2 [Gigaspora margarita]